MAITGMICGIFGICFALAQLCFHILWGCGFSVFLPLAWTFSGAALGMGVLGIVFGAFGRGLSPKFGFGLRRGTWGLVLGILSCALVLVGILFSMIALIFF